MESSAVVSLLLLAALVRLGGEALSTEYYHKTCPAVEETVEAAVKKATANDNTVPAALLRMHFHDCFVRGCDGSVLIDSTGNNTAEKDGSPNTTLDGFSVIDNAKDALEKLCPGVVSCADILTIAARAAVTISGGPTWKLHLGRLDGRTSLASETSSLPSSRSDFSQLKQSFANRGLSVTDLTALSGGHTLGFAHCAAFGSRIRGFNSSNGVDPSMDPSFASSLRRLCPAQNVGKNAGSTMDSTSTTFDNAYYKMLVKKEGLFTSDAVLLTNSRAMGLVSEFAASQEAFFEAFAKSMIRMSSLTGGVEVRSNCRKIN